MPRTTVDIDAPILKDLKRLQKEQRKSLGQLISDLLAEALARLLFQHGVRTLFASDVDSRRFAFLGVRNPFA